MGYVSRYQRIGDPGFFSDIGRGISRAVSGVARVAGSVLRSPVGQIASVLVPGGILAKAGLGVLGKTGAVGRVVGGIVGLTRGRRGVAAASAAVAAATGAAVKTVGAAGGAGQALKMLGSGAAGAAAGFWGGAGLRKGEATGEIDPFTGKPIRKKYRKINPLNARAARRAIRRIRGVRKITSDIERMLPRARVGSHAHRVWSFPRRRRKK